jgi:hypothetical protein
MKIYCASMKAKERGNPYPWLFRRLLSFWEIRNNIFGAGELYENLSCQRSSRN